MLTLAVLTGRIERLDGLTRGLAKEVLVWREGGDPLLYLERKAYIGAIQDAIAALETARVALARGVQRIQEAEGSRGPRSASPEGDAGMT